MKSKTQIKFLNKDDIFFLDGKKYIVSSNENISSSFNEIHTICEGEEYNLRLRKNEAVWVEHPEFSLKTNKVTPTSGINKIRNVRGNLVSVNFRNVLTENAFPIPRAAHIKLKVKTIIKERKLSKGETEKRDDCVKALMGNPKFVKKYKKMSNVHHPGRTIDDVAYGTCTMHAKGEKTKQREEEGKRKSKKKKTNESVERLDTIRKAIRRTSE